MTAARLPSQPYRLLLLNPNTSVLATELMLLSARSVLPHQARIKGRTMPHGQAFLASPEALESAAQAMPAFGRNAAGEGFDGLIVAAFGEPGLPALRQQLQLPVTGLAEAGIAEAAQGGRRYAIVTVTPLLHHSLLASAHAYAPASQLASIRYTQGDIAAVMDSPKSLEDALFTACALAVEEDRAEAIVIGGGPLARSAQALAQRLPVPVIDPVCAAVRLACQRAGL